MQLIKFEGQLITNERRKEIYRHLSNLLSKNEVDYKQTDLQIIVTIGQGSNLPSHIEVVCTDNELAKKVRKIISADHEVF